MGSIVQAWGEDPAHPAAGAPGVQVWRVVFPRGVAYRRSPNLADTFWWERSAKCGELVEGTLVLGLSWGPRTRKLRRHRSLR